MGVFVVITVALIVNASKTMRAKQLEFKLWCEQCAREHFQTLYERQQRKEALNRQGRVLANKGKKVNAFIIYLSFYCLWIWLL